MVTTKVGGSLIAILFTIGLLGLPNTAAAQASGIRLINVSVPFTTTFAGLSNPLTNPCTGESVDVSGVTSLSIILNDSASGAILVKLSAVTKGAGVASPSGVIYSFSENTQVTFNIAAGQLGSEQTLTEKLRFKGAGSVDNWDVKELIHVTVNANGTTTASVDNLTAVCRG